MICIKKLRSLRSLVTQEQKLGARGHRALLVLEYNPVIYFKAGKTQNSLSCFVVKLWNEIPCHIRDLPKKEFTNVNQGFALRYFNRENDYFKTPLII